MQMGCHGIDVSRLRAAVASALVDNRGLNWPYAITPFQVIIIPRDLELVGNAVHLYDKITSECPGVDGHPRRSTRVRCSV
jgi:prolyl-tRNA synthetase